MKKKQLSFILVAGIAGVVIGYLIMSFLCWGFNPGVWGEYTARDYNYQTHTYYVYQDIRLLGVARFFGVLLMIGGGVGVGFLGNYIYQKLEEE